MYAWFLDTKSIQNTGGIFSVKLKYSLLVQNTSRFNYSTCSMIEGEQRGDAVPCLLPRETLWASAAALFWAQVKDTTWKKRVLAQSFENATLSSTTFSLQSNVPNSNAPSCKLVVAFAGFGWSRLVWIRLISADLPS
jgi:hypothetical protein